MQVTKEQKKQAIAHAKAHKVKRMWMNDKGEFFTTENYASLSVGGKKDKFTEVNIGDIDFDEKPAGDFPDKADELIALIEAAESAEVVQAIIDAETKGKARKKVLEAGAAKLETLNS